MSDRDRPGVLLTAFRWPPQVRLAYVLNTLWGWVYRCKQIFFFPTSFKTGSRGDVKSTSDSHSISFPPTAMQHKPDAQSLIF